MDSIENERAALQLEIRVLPRQRIVGQQTCAVLKKRLHQQNRLRFLGHVRKGLVREAQHGDGQIPRHPRAELLQHTFGQPPVEAVSG